MHVRSCSHLFGPGNTHSLRRWLTRRQIIPAHRIRNLLLADGAAYRGAHLRGGRRAEGLTAAAAGAAAWFGGAQRAAEPGGERCASAAPESGSAADAGRRRLQPVDND
jgi:hypothetical protein